MDAELESILRECKIKVITREGQCPQAACRTTSTIMQLGLSRQIEAVVSSGIAVGLPAAVMQGRRSF